MIEYKEIEDRYLENLSLDYVPLNDIVREFSGFNQAPTENDFIDALRFIEYLSNKYNIKCLLGPKMSEIQLSTKELMEWLKHKWYSGQYSHIDYGVWFELNDKK